MIDVTVPKAELLTRWRQQRGTDLLPEKDLLQEMLYLLQGINGHYVGFEHVTLPASNDVDDAHGPEIVVKLRFYDGTDARITPPTKQLIHRIAELGRLYKRIDDFHRSNSVQKDVGLTMQVCVRKQTRIILTFLQSLCHFLSSELTSYYRLISILEAQMNQPSASNSSSHDRSTAGLTLKRVAVWTEDVLLRLRMMSTIIESCQDAHGGAIVSLIHSYTFHGDPLIRKFTAEILDHVARPFFQMLSQWIFQGKLQDPFDEFFVERNKGLKVSTSVPNEEDDLSALHMSSFHDTPAPPSSLWQNQFRFRPEMLPSFLDETFGKKIFSTGKSLHFIRFSCGDGDWVSSHRRDDGVENADGAVLRYANLPGLEKTIDEAYAMTSARLLEIFLGKFKLLDHLRALKDYLMLTKGDFVDLLMESIAPSLDRPASSLFRHNLTASLETSLRGSNSQFESTDIVGRLDARILDYNEGDLGWDSFTLEYRVDEPVNTVLDGQAMLGYQVIFHHLWKLKRVELALGRSWESLTLAINTLQRTNAKTLRRRGGRSQPRVESQGTSCSALLNSSHDALGQLNEHIHFVKQMQGFVNLEVIEYSWNDLVQLLSSHTAKKRPLDLDELISSHRAYLNALIGKVLLRSSSSSAKRGDQLAHEVKNNMDTMLFFAAAIEDLAQHITDELAHAELGTTASQAKLNTIHQRLSKHHVHFQQATQLILGKLEKHSNLVVRDLATRINFNSFYHGTRRANNVQHDGHTVPVAATAA